MQDKICHRGVRNSQNFCPEAIKFALQTLQYIENRPKGIEYRPNGVFSCEEMEKSLHCSVKYAIRISSFWIIYAFLVQMFIIKLYEVNLPIILGYEEKFTNFLLSYWNISNAIFFLLLGCFCHHLYAFEDPLGLHQAANCKFTM